MSDFVQFARDHGLILDHPVADGRWHRVKTVDHPKKRNGAYAFWGDRGCLQNWATMERTAAWRQNGEAQYPAPRAAVVASALEHRQRYAEAGQRAATLLSECEEANHPYLVRKGFQAAVGLVHPNGELLIPMRDVRRYDQINSAQRISPDGTKKFLLGGKAKGSVFRMGSRGPFWLVEGYATGLTVFAALRDLHQQARVLVCFSAGNLVHVAQFIPAPAFVFADHDESQAGKKAAIDSGLPYCMSAQIGDANDLHQSKGLRAVCSLMLDTQNAAEDFAA